MSVHALESVVRRAPLAVRAVDAATGLPISDDVEATAWPSSAPAASTTSNRPTAKGVLGFRRLPGMGSYEDALAEPESWFGTPHLLPRVPFTVRVVDRKGRFLPVVRTVTVPSPAPIDVLLPSAPARLAPPGFGLVVGQAILEGSHEPAAWAMVQVDVGGHAVGGVTDPRGAFAVPVPLLTAPNGPTTPSSGPSWNAHVSIRFQPAAHARAAGTSPADPPTFESIAAQAPALVLDNWSPVASLTRPLTRSGALVVSSDPTPPPAVLMVRPAS